MNFGVLARNFIAGQGRYRPENVTPPERAETPYQTFVDSLHVSKQPCPGCCNKTVCWNSFCQAHPLFIKPRSLPAGEQP